MDTHELEARLSRLETSLARQRCVSVMLGVLLIAPVGIAMRQQEVPPNVLRVRQLEVVDAEGRSCVTIRTSPSPRIEVGSVGQQRGLVSLSATNDGGSIDLARRPDNGGDVIYLATLSCDGQSGGRFCLNDPDGSLSIAGYGKIRDGGPQLSIIKGGNYRISLGTTWLEQGPNEAAWTKENSMVIFGDGRRVATRLPEVGK